MIRLFEMNGRCVYSAEQQPGSTQKKPLFTIEVGYYIKYNDVHSVYNRCIFIYSIKNTYKRKMYRMLVYAQAIVLCATFSYKNRTK